jgi:CubicO group peptidase (beta-lactamase class C family)
MTTSSLPTGDPEALGFDAERLSRIGPAMQKLIDDEKVPNLVTLVARKGQIVHLDARGVMDLDTRKPVDTSTLFRLYSNTKPIAGVATMILFEAGLLTPDDPVSKFLPEYADLRVASAQFPMMTERAKRGITIRDCLTHTTGLMSATRATLGLRAQYREAFEALGWARGSDATAKPAPTYRERVKAMAQIPLYAQPGEHFEYHIGYLVLGAVLEEACGQPLDQFFREQIFEPLGMKDTDFYLPEGALDRFPACYVPRQVDGQWKLTVSEKAEESEKALGPKVFFGVGGDAGGVLSTIGDYARFGQMLLNGGELDGKRILGRKTLDLMKGNHTGDMVIPMTGPGFHWGLGVSVYHGRGIPPLMLSPGTFFWGGAAGTTFRADPVEDLLSIIFTQVLQHGMMPGNTYQEDFRRLVYQALV